MVIEMKISGKFGASSPERERKLLSLAESGPSTRKTTKVLMFFMIISRVAAIIAHVAAKSGI